MFENVFNKIREKAELYLSENYIISVCIILLILVLNILGITDQKIKDKQEAKKEKK